MRFAVAVGFVLALAGVGADAATGACAGGNPCCFSLAAAVAGVFFYTSTDVYFIGIEGKSVLHCNARAHNVEQVTRVKTGIATYVKVRSEERRVGKECRSGLVACD